MLIGYARVSTADQNLDAQLDELTAVGCEKVFSEKVTGKRDSQPELAKLLEQLRAGDTVIVCKIDRLGRRMLELLETVEKIQKLGAEFRSVAEAVDTGTQAGKMFFQMACMFADFERGRIAERTKAGLNAAKKRGRVGGRPPALTAEQVDQVRTLQASGEPTAKIARLFKVSRSTVRRVASA